VNTIRNSINSDIPVKLETVFLPYKASMWDSLESVWRKADADPSCDAYVIPIPYFDRNPDGSAKEEHYEGNDVFEREFIYALHEDGTGLVRGNDDFRITWDDKNIYWEVPTEEGIESHEYKLEGNILKVKEVDGWQEYTKKPGDDPIENGDLVEFAGVYSKIENSEAEKENAKTYGDMYFSYGGMIGGGEGYPQVWPDKITKNEDGSYLCEYDNYDFEYIIYPKGVIGEKEASDPELKDKLYIKVAIKKDGETKDIVFYRSAQF
jgi:hypothetical protein